jgi:hypothetical protein
MGKFMFFLRSPSSLLFLHPAGCLHHQSSLCRTVYEAAYVGGESPTKGLKMSLIFIWHCHRAELLSGTLASEFCRTDVADKSPAPFLAEETPQ